MLIDRKCTLGVYNPKAARAVTVNHTSAYLHTTAQLPLMPVHLQANKNKLTPCHFA